LPLYNRKIIATVEKENAILATLEDFRMSFDIRKTSVSTEPNTGSLSIYNLSDPTISQLNELGALLTVKAGYEDWEGPEVVFIGDTTYITTKATAPNRITRLEAGDGEQALTFTRDSLSFKKGATIRQILNNVVKKFSIGVKTKLDLIDFRDKVLNTGFSFSGQLKNVLDILTNDVDLQWSVQNNELKIYNKDGTDQTQAIVINENTGMIGSPERIKIQKMVKDDEIEIDGWAVTTLLHSKAEPGGIISLSSREVGENKQFKIHTSSHRGDNFEGDFVTSIEVEDFSGK
jgi:hypothetical protein